MKFSRIFVDFLENYSYKKVNLYCTSSDSECNFDGYVDICWKCRAYWMRLLRLIFKEEIIEIKIRKIPWKKFIELKFHENFVNLNCDVNIFVLSITWSYIHNAATSMFFCLWILYFMSFYHFNQLIWIEFIVFYWSHVLSGRLSAQAKRLHQHL